MMKSAIMFVSLVAACASAASSHRAKDAHGEATPHEAPSPVERGPEESTLSPPTGHEHHAQERDEGTWRACIVGLLEYLGTRNKFRGSFDAAATLELDLPRVLANISPTGITLSQDRYPSSKSNAEPDVAPATRLRKEKAIRAVLSAKEVELQLSKRSGPAFIELAHLGYVYSIGAPNQSALTFETAGDQVRVTVGREEYELTFDVTDGACLLREVYYRAMEEE